MHLRVNRPLLSPAQQGPPERNPTGRYRLGREITTTRHPLTSETLGLHAARVEIPSYDRSALVPAVVHISVGSFHRSHQAVYFDELARRGVLDWGIVGVGHRRRDMQEALAAQDNLYTVLERGADGDRARIVGAMVDYLFAPDDPAAVVRRLADPRTRLVTLTVTARGYCIDPASRRFDPDAPDIVGDLTDPTRPRSALGFIVEGLARRRRAGLPGFTVLSCDNMPEGGAVTRSAVVGYARLRDAALADWIDASVSFPSSMVDRITPQTTPEDRELVAREFGVDDRWPVVTEPFSQWVIEDAFCNGRPPLELAGARFVPDVRPYALTKTRLLNAAHCALGYLGSLAGLERTDEAMEDAIFGTYVERLMRVEIAPQLPSVPGIDLPSYRRALLARLSNPAIGDPLRRLCRGGSGKMPCHVLPSIAGARSRGRPHPLLTLAVAGWVRYLRGVDEQGREIHINDALADRLRVLAAPGSDNLRPLLAQRALFGRLGDDPAFVFELRAALRRIERDGARAAVAAAVDAWEPLAA